MPTFAIDASSANKPNRSGVEWYAYHLIEAIKKQPLIEGEKIIFYSPETLKWWLPFLWMKGRVSWEMWKRGRTGRTGLKSLGTVLLVPAQGLPFIGKSVAVIHDVGFRRVPNVYESGDRRRQESELKRTIKKAKKIFCVSEFTKREVVELFKVSEDRIVVAPNAVDTNVFRPMDESATISVLQKYRLGRHFFLYVGRMDEKKNVKTIIRAFELFKASRGLGDPFELVLVGARGFQFDQIKTYVDRSNAKQAIKYLGYLPESETSALMNATTAFLFPSWYEGFGVPPLEAAACGAPLIVSDIGAHREVLQGAAIFVKPSEPEAWGKILMQIAADPSIGQALRPKGFERAAAYSWDATAKIVLETLRGLV